MVVNNIWEHALRDVDGTINVIEWTHGVFDRSVTYATSLPLGRVVEDGMGISVYVFRGGED